MDVIFVITMIWASLSSHEALLLILFAQHMKLTIEGPSLAYLREHSLHL